MTGDPFPFDDVFRPPPLPDGVMFADLYKELDDAASRNEAPAVALHVVTLDEFVAVDEPGAAALVGAGDNVLIPDGGDVMFYGDGGAGKTTLAVDLACHLAAGDPWLNIPVARPVRVLLIENEGPRPQFRKKLGRKVAAWAGSDLSDRLSVLENPWAIVRFTSESHREALADVIQRLDLDVVVIGPVTRSGMDEAGTLQQVRDFGSLLGLVRQAAARPVTFVLIHHENKGGQVSGAWEGAGDTLLHVTAQGNGSTRLFIQKARWSSSQHNTTLQLRWTDGDGFEVVDTPERDDDTIADELRAFVLHNGGTSWRNVEQSDTVTGKGEKLRTIRDRLLTAGLLIDAGSSNGKRLWHPDDPACPARDTPGTHPVSPPSECGIPEGCVPVSRRSRDTPPRDTPARPHHDDNEQDEELAWR